MFLLADVVIFSTAALQEQISLRVKGLNGVQLVIPDMLEDFDRENRSCP